MIRFVVCMIVAPGIGLTTFYGMLTNNFWLIGGSLLAIPVLHATFPLHKLFPPGS